MSATAGSLVELGNELTEEGRWTEAAEAYRRAAVLDPNWSVPWYN
ncbi:MAG TPA: tetratricopeptide repeat protein, partial [Chromatiales bacterium]|nr:tetratricopeptide repeat protein [Chromatiales bacterium]